VRRNEATEQAIVVAASLAHHMIVQEGLPAGLATEATGTPWVVGDDWRRISLPPRIGRAQLMSMLEVLARVTPAVSRPSADGNPAAGKGFADLLRQESVHLPWGSTLVVITGQVSEELAQTMLYLKRSGHAMGLILIQPDYLRTAEGQYGGVAGIPVHRVWTDRDLAVWQ
jgi:uncharacterized protein (DUF58 family)